MEGTTADERIVHPSNHVSQFQRESHNFCDNSIKTSKYTWYTFLPINMYEQFSRLSNAYFFVLMILQLIPQISSLSPITTIIPLVFVISVSAIKDIYDDYIRHVNDDEVNNRTCLVHRDGVYVYVKWIDVTVGDIIKLNSEEKVPADIVLLSTTNEGICLIETAELDGETNLKSRNAPTVLVDLFKGDQLDRDFKVTSELPNKNLEKFNGKVELGGKDSFPLNNNNVVLRGCVIRNTENVVGIVIFTGNDTKIIMNSGKLRLKRTHLDVYVNNVIFQILIFLLLSVLILVIGQGIWEKIHGVKLRPFIPWAPFLSKNVDLAIFVKSLLSLFSNIIIMNAVIPISLYVSVEFIRFWHSKFINWDDRMYDQETDSYAKARTTSLIEELGQIKYIFSDKTGTLTQNLMKFRQCSINGVKYTETQQDVLTAKIKSGDGSVALFMEILALCHTVMISTNKEGEDIFLAQSPDEGALVEAAKNFGFIFVNRTDQIVEINSNGGLKTFELLAVLDFDNFRKRMSVVVRLNSKIYVFTKGADATVYAVLSKSQSSVIRDVTDQHLNEFACSGLRTLCMAYKEISQADFARWFDGYSKAAMSVTNRAELLDESIAELESNLILVGATGIEDKLQHNVANTIYSLISAKIRIWVLTGDKLETAVNIGYSCRLLTNDMYEVFMAEKTDPNILKDQIMGFLAAINANLEKQDTNIANFIKSYDSLSDFEEYAGFSLVITGPALETALTCFEDLFVELVSCCKTVICCRVTPLQKSQVVNLIKRHKRAITLSIGDGANDVSMIKEADIGVGISGKEGRQAVLASDYCISQFRFLEWLVLYHGRLSYYRLCRFMAYFFYKSFTFAFSQFIFSFFSGFSSQIIYNPIFMASYNMVYTSVPVLVMAIFDKDVTEEALLTNPKLYEAGIRNKLFNRKVFFLAALEGCLSSTVIVLFTYASFNGAVNAYGANIDDIYTVQHVVMTLLTILVTFRCALYMNTWTVLHHVSIWGSILAYFAVVLFLSADIISTTAIGAAYTVFESPIFWLLLPLVITCLLLPVAVYKAVQAQFRPSYVQKLIKRKNGDKLRNKMSYRRGYAFSQQDDIGKYVKPTIL